MAIIIACVVVFLATLFSPRLFTYLGLSPFLVQSRPWTVITNLFVHAGWGHIFTNMFTLYFFGTYLATLIGDRLFLWVYFGAGLAGNLLMLALAPLFPFSIAVGASGAVFGLGGALTALRPKQQVMIFPIPAPIPMWVAVVGGFVILSFFPSVAWQAHLGGLLFGLIFGFFLKRRRYY